MQTVRWGILGTARIATKIAAAIEKAPHAELVAVASRSASKAAAWAGEHRVPRSFGSYEAMLQECELDAVYIPLPPSLHHEWTLNCAERRLHVLCEKPLALNATQAAEMLVACQQYDVQFMDGVMWWHHERTRVMEQLLREGTIGEVARVTSAFTFVGDMLGPDNIRFQPELGGGALFDLGWYCVGAALWAFAGAPERVFGTARYRGSRATGVDENLSAMMWFPGDRLSTFDCGFDVSRRKWFEIAGTTGSLVCDDFVAPWSIDAARFWLHGAEGKVSQHAWKNIVQEAQMIEHFSQLVQSGSREWCWGERAVQTQRICDAIAQSARAERVVEL